MALHKETDLATGFSLPVAEILPRYRRSVRKRVARLARLDDRVADLAVSFPALMVALAAGTAWDQEKARAIRIVRDGGSLKDAAAALNMAYWMRKLPPEAFVQAPSGLPQSVNLQKRLPNLMPKEAKATAAWLQFVEAAQDLGDDTFTTWVAGTRLDWERVSHSLARSLTSVGIYVWFSSSPAHEAGLHAPRRWSSSMSWTNTLDDTCIWLRKLAEVARSDALARADTWLRGGKIDGYQFVPLMTAEALETEGQVMCHCAGDYALAVASGQCRVFAIRERKRAVATLEIRPHHDDGRMPMIVQLRGYDNADVPADVWKAVYLWMGRQPTFDLPGEAPDAAVQPDPRVWQRLFRPYDLDRGLPRSWPTEPANADLDEVLRGLYDLKLQPTV